MRLTNFEHKMIKEGMYIVMKEDILIEKLEKIFYQCDKDIIRINSSTNELKSIMPLDSKKYKALLDEEIKTLDQFLFRFAKLQDTMGQKLFRTILLFLKEDIEGRAFIDILNLMEKLHLLDSANEWKELRDDRNDLAHNYEDEPIIASEIINRLYYKKDILIGIYQTIKEYYIKYV